MSQISNVQCVIRKVAQSSHEAVLLFFWGLNDLNTMKKKRGGQLDFVKLGVHKKLCEMIEIPDQLSSQR